MDWQRTHNETEPRFRVVAPVQGAIASVEHLHEAGRITEQWATEHPHRCSPWVIETATHNHVTRQALAAWFTESGRGDLPQADPDGQRLIHDRVSRELVERLVHGFTAASMGTIARDRPSNATTLRTEVTMRCVDLATDAEMTALDVLIAKGTQHLASLGVADRQAVRAWRDAATSYDRLRTNWDEVFAVPGTRPRVLVLEHRHETPHRVIAAVDQVDALVRPILRQRGAPSTWTPISGELWMCPADFAVWAHDRGLRMAEAA